ncbi:hypothetical protein BJY00DRAFT_176922 [Aspergillus carlsbadensis]|nr:hypothetical protein BJY00DRAFT_176922 [Aspergillus carlsbadensis]
MTSPRCPRSPSRKSNLRQVGREQLNGADRVSRRHALCYLIVKELARQYRLEEELGK